MRQPLLIEIHPGLSRFLIAVVPIIGNEEMLTYNVWIPIPETYTK